MTRERHCKGECRDRRVGDSGVAETILRARLWMASGHRYIINFDVQWRQQVVNEYSEY